MRPTILRPGPVRSRRPAWAAALCLTACTGDGPASDSGSSATDSAAVDSGAGTDDTALPGLEHAPAFTAQELVDALAISLDAGFPDPRTLVDEYTVLMAQGDETCPGLADDFFEVLNGCTSESDYWYMGRGGFVVDASEDGAADYRYNISTIDADFEIETPTHQEYVAGGVLELYSSSDGGGSSTWLKLVGTWQWEGGATAWERDGVSAGFELTGSWVEEDAEMVLTGTLGSQGTYFYFDELGFTGGDCSWQPTSGAVWLRQSDATWNVLAFDGTCSGCASVSWRDEDLGEACADLTGFGKKVAKTAFGGAEP